MLHTLSLLLHLRLAALAEGSCVTIASVARTGRCAEPSRWRPAELRWPRECLKGPPQLGELIFLHTSIKCWITSRHIWYGCVWPITIASCNYVGLPQWRR